LEFQVEIPREFVLTAVQEHPRSSMMPIQSPCYFLLTFLVFEISRVLAAITAKRMKTDPYCQRRNCSPLNVVYSDVYDIDCIDIARRSSARGR